MNGKVDLLGFHALYRADKVVAIDSPRNRHWTYAELDHSCGQCAANLKNYEVDQGDRVVCLAKNRVELISLHFACARIGAIYVPINWRLSKTEINSLIEDAEPKLIIGDELLKITGIKGIGLDLFLDQSSKLEALPYSLIDNTLPSLILYTSGTSGRPKGVLLSENNLAETAINFSLVGKVENHSVVMSDAPMFHIIGLITVVRPVILQGATFVVSDGFEPAKTLSRLADPELMVTHYFCVPVMADLIKAESDYSPEKLNKLTAIFTGGAPYAEAKIQDWIKDGILVANGFGMSEAGTVFGMPVDIDLIAARPGSTGISTSRIKTRIVDKDGKSCLTGTLGELQLKGSNITSGYWRRPEDNAKIFTEDGWFCTGDIARCDEEGYFWIVDRLKDMFISGGENVYPGEIESLLADNPAIKECTVIGRPDDKWGEVGHLFVAPVDPKAEFDSDALISGLSGKLARFKLPKYVSLLEALPRNANGKIVKSALLGKINDYI
ncbi:MAG: AMP-binding protein [Gammaproteobacteria bacterium]|nr:AMP-binding protein [Gammaproteobacteria bacterium]